MSEVVAMFVAQIQTPVIPAQAGIQRFEPKAYGLLPWVPAFAGTNDWTSELC
jgi:hypothetical protein